MAYIGFTAVNLPHGYLVNMFAAQIVHIGETWRTSEALFYALRFSNQEIRELIRADKSPMGAKMMARKHKSDRVIIPLSEEDIENMRLCLRLKFTQDPELKAKLLSTGKHIIYEDISARNTAKNRFWGAVRVGNDLKGTNKLGELLMELREVLTRVNE